ncbi:MAG: dTDP-4-dehydrorhamnose 3,5-epimerase [Victivallaceae bacterium]
MPFIFENAPLAGIKIITPRVFPDGRGIFFESYKKSDFAAAGITEDFCQDNRSVSEKGVLRGLHYQQNPYAQGKLVSVLFGAIYDVVVDVRVGSPGYGKWFGAELSAENRKMLYVPPGFAHGFLALTDVQIMYKCTCEYNKNSESGIIWNDSAVGIKWPVVGEVHLSDKDAILLPLAQAANNFIYGE